MAASPNSITRLQPVRAGPILFKDSRSASVHSGPLELPLFARLVARCLLLKTREITRLDPPLNRKSANPKCLPARLRAQAQTLNYHPPRLALGKLCVDLCFGGVPACWLARGGYRFPWLAWLNRLHERYLDH